MTIFFETFHAPITNASVEYEQTRLSQADSSSFLFHGRHPERSLTTRQVRFRFNRWKALSGIREELTVHSFRAGFATHLYRATGDSLLVQHAIGHSDIRTRSVISAIIFLKSAKPLKKDSVKAGSFYDDKKMHTPCYRWGGRSCKTASFIIQEKDGKDRWSLF